MPIPDTFKGDALMAIGKAEVELGHMDAARTAFERIRSDLPGSTYAKQALVDHIGGRQAEPECRRP